MSSEFINFPPAVVGLISAANFEPEDAPDTIEVTVQMPKNFTVSRKNVVMIDLDLWTEFAAKLTENEREYHVFTLR